MSKKKVVKSFLWGTLTGAVTGAVTALLFAPKSGRELRGDIAETAHKVGGKTADISRHAGTAVHTLAKRTSDLIVESKHAAGKLVTDIRSRKSNDSVEDDVVSADVSTNEDKVSIR